MSETTGDAYGKAPGGRLARWFETQPETLLAILVAGQILLWTALPALFFEALPLDVLENVGWSRDFEWGYYKHPPLQVWFTSATLALPGHAVWPLYLLGPLASALAFLAIYRFGSEIADRRAGLLAALLFSLVFYASFAVSEFNANVVQLPIWAFATIALWRGLNRPGLLWWIVLGAMVALGVYAKYSSAVLVASLVITAMLLPAGRRALLTPGPYVAAILAILLSLPNFIWLVETGYLPLQYAAARSAKLALLGRLANPLGFFVTQIADSAGAILMLAIGWGIVRKARTGDGVRFASAPDARRYVVAMAILPLALTMAIPVLTGSGVRDMWGGPLLIWVPLAAILLLKPAYRRPLLAPMLTTWLILFVAAPVIAAAISAAGPRLGIKPQRTSLPARELTAALVDAWHSATPARLGIVAGDTWESGAVAAYAADRPSVFVGASATINPWIDPGRIEREGVLVVWPAAVGDMPLEYRPLGPFAAEGTVAAPIAGTQKTLSMRWAARPPGVKPSP